MTVTQTNGATATNYTLSVERAQAKVINQYGFSLIWTYQEGTGTEYIFDPNSDTPTVSITDVIHIRAYVVYSSSVGTTQIENISAFVVAGNNDMVFKVTASDVVPSP